MTAPAAADRAAVLGHIDRTGRGVLATVAPDGAPEAALVSIAARADGTLIVDAREVSRKVAHLRSEPRVAVVVGTDGDVTVQLEGIARITADAERERFGGDYLRRFPGSRPLAPGFVVIAIDVHWVRVYDASAEPPVVREATWPSPAR